jgi:hypothetical protein
MIQTNEASKNLSRILDIEGTTINRESLRAEECRALRTEVAHLNEQVRDASEENEHAEERETARQLGLEDRYAPPFFQASGNYKDKWMDDVFVRLTGCAKP